MWRGAVDETNERPQFECNSIIVVQRRIEGESVLVTNCQSAAGQVFGEVEHSLYLSRCKSTQATLSPPLPN